jgi:hypothetical protein
MAAWSLLLPMQINVGGFNLDQQNREPVMDAFAFAVSTPKGC